MGGVVALDAVLAGEDASVGRARVVVLERRGGAGSCRGGSAGCGLFLVGRGSMGVRGVAADPASWLWFVR